MLAAGVILAIMILPIISSLTREVMSAVPHAQREAVLALGATRWEMIRMGVLRNARIGIVGAVILGLGRALGETMAVTMVIGNRPEIAKSLFAPGYQHGQRDRQRIQRSLRRPLPERPDRDRAGALYCHHHRERAGAAAGVGGHPRRAGTRQLAGTNLWLSGSNTSAANRIWRSVANNTGDRAGCAGSTILVMAPLVAIFVYLLFKGASSLNLAFFTQTPKPVGEVGGGMANSILGSGILLGDRQPDGRAHRHRRRHLPRGVWPRRKAGQHGPLYRGCAQRCAVDRHGHRHLLADRAAAKAFLRACPAAWRWAS